MGGSGLVPQGFGRRLAAVMAPSGISQVEAAELVGVAKQTFSERICEVCDEAELAPTRASDL